MRRPVLACVLATVFAVAALAACGGSAATTTSSSAAANAKADLQVKEGAHAILEGVQMLAVTRFPARYPARATEALLDGHMLKPWPINPFTGAAMKPGSGRGDYEYTVAANRRSCQVTVHLSDGSRFATQVMRIE